MLSLEDYKGQLTWSKRIMSRTATALLSTENLLHNVKIIKQKVGSARVIAMVKANAYGHGIRSVSKRLDGHVDMLGVASIDEAMALRQCGVQSPILLAQGVFQPDELKLASTEGFHVAFHHEMQVDWLEHTHLSKPLNAWIKINTGLGRLGFAVENALEYYDKLSSNPHIAAPVRLMSHFSCADEPEHPLNEQQKQTFKTLISQIDTEYSLCNSSGLFHFPECHYDYVRPGIALYGVHPIKGHRAAELGLKPVMTIQSSLMSVHTLQKGACVGYSARYQCPENMPVGIIAFGYGDGYPLTAQDGTPILVNHQECPLIGRVSMDMIAVDLRNCPHAKVGDQVILWGNELPIERVAEHTANITWDMLTGVQNRVKFVW